MKLFLRVIGCLALTMTITAAYLVYRGHAQSVRLMRVADRVQMTYGQLDALAHSVGKENESSYMTADDIVYLLACSGVPTRETMPSMTSLAVKLVLVRDYSERRAVEFVLSIPPNHFNSFTLEGC